MRQGGVQNGISCRQYGIVSCNGHVPAFPRSLATQYSACDWRAKGNRQRAVTLPVEEDLPAD